MGGAAQEAVGCAHGRNLFDGADPHNDGHTSSLVTISTVPPRSGNVESSLRIEPDAGITEHQWSGSEDAGGESFFDRDVHYVHFGVRSRSRPWLWRPLSGRRAVAHGRRSADTRTARRVGHVRTATSDIMDSCRSGSPLCCSSFLHSELSVFGWIIDVRADQLRCELHWRRSRPYISARSKSRPLCPDIEDRYLGLPTVHTTAR